MAKEYQDETSRAVIDFVAKRVPYYKNPITPNTSILNDLKLWGDDAWDLLVEFVKTFHIDAESLMFDEFFPGEGLGPIDAVASLVAPLTRQTPKHNYAPLTVADLIRAAHKGAFEKC